MRCSRRRALLAVIVIEVVGIAWLVLVLAGLYGCDDPGEPFCALARCPVACSERLGACVEIGTGADGRQHRFEPGADRAICGTTTRRHGPAGAICDMCQHAAPLPHD